ncbi:MAG: hypothetical protein AAB554_04930 [Patescibacteria group bacterium]
MANLLKTLVLFVFGFALLANIGDALEKKSGTPAASALAAAVSSSEIDAASINPEPKPVAGGGTHSQICASFDPVAHPEQVIDILEYASQTTGAPVDVLYAIWRNETGHVDGAGAASGRCNMREELQIRCTLGKSCGHLNAMLGMAEKFAWNLETMTCSCGTATWDDNTHYYGGCCGPFQFSGAEIVDNAMAHGLDPMSFCGGAILAGWELKEHHDRFLKKGVVSTSIEAWRRAVSRYFGADRENKYWRKAYAQWDTFHDWYRHGPETLRRKVTEKSAYSARYHRGLRASN